MILDQLSSGPELAATLFASATLASIIQRVSGFGFGIFIMTILPHIMPYHEALALSGLLALTQSIMIVAKNKALINWKAIVPMFAIFLVFSTIATSMVKYIDKTMIMHILGVTLILFSVYFFFFSDKIHIKGSIPAQLSLGSLSGILGGFFGMQGPPVVLYYVQSEPDNQHYITQTQTFFLLANTAMTAQRWHFGFVTAEVAWFWVMAIAGVLAGSIVGRHIFDKISAATLRHIVYAYMALSGVLAILK